MERPRGVLAVRRAVHLQAAELFLWERKTPRDTKEVEPGQVGEQREVGLGVVCPMPAMDFDDAVGDFDGQVERRKVQSLKNNPHDTVGKRINHVEARHVVDHHQVGVGEEADGVQWRVGKRHGVLFRDRVASVQ